MASNVTCDYISAAWEVNVRNETACQVYAQLQAQCDSSFIIQPVIQASPPYTPPNNLCGCNVVAYNLMAGCAWCQLPIQSGWWLTVSRTYDSLQIRRSMPEWAGNCTGVQFNPTSIPASISTDNIIVPPWALAIPTGTTWNPTQASDIAVPPSSTSSTSTSASPTSVSTPRTTSTFPTSFSFPSDTGSSAAGNAGQSVGIAFGVILGLWALSAIIVVIVYFSRQTQRRAWYAPMAAFYQAQKGGYGGGGGGYGQYPPNTPHGATSSTAPLIYPNQYQAGASPSNATTNSASIVTSTGYQPPPTNSNGFHSSAAVGYNATSYVPPPPEPNYHVVQGGVGAPGRFGGSSRPTAWGSSGGGNTANMYGGVANTYGSQTALGASGMASGVSQAPLPGAQGGYRGHAEVY